MDTMEVIGIDRDTGHFLYTQGDVVGLVVTPFAQSPRVQGYGQKYIDIVPIACIHQLEGSYATEASTQFGLLTVLECVDEVLHLRALAEEEPRSSASEVGLSIEEFFGIVARQPGLFCTRQALQAGGTNPRLVLPEQMPTDRTEAGKE